MFMTLIVEDHPSYRRSFVEILQQRFPSMIVEEAKDGREALQKISTTLPDLIFMDIKLPEENGLDLTKRIRTEYPTVGIIILTSYDLQEYREAAYQHGADYFFAKGISSVQEILTLVGAISN